jgi:aspartate 1-decarboxylase
VRRRMPKSKFHRAVVTDANLHDVGSATIDAANRQVHAVAVELLAGGRSTPSRYVEVPAN